MEFKVRHKSVISAAVMCVLSASANAAMYAYDQPFSAGGVSKPDPDGAGPWLSLVTTDAGVNTVELALTAALSGSNFISSVYFNLDPALDAAKLSFTSSSSGASVLGFVTDPASSALKADGDGTYDIRVDFDTANNKDARFDGSDTVTLTISSSEAISAGSFGFFSEPPTGGAGPYLSAAHVQGLAVTATNPSGSTWIAAVPVPAGLILLGSALPLLFNRRRSETDSLARAL